MSKIVHLCLEYPTCSVAIYTTHLIFLGVLYIYLCQNIFMKHFHITTSSTGLMPCVKLPFECVDCYGVLVVIVLICSASLFLHLYLCNRGPHVLINPIETTRWFVHDHFPGEIFFELPSCHGFSDIQQFIKLTLISF